MRTQISDFLTTVLNYSMIPAMKLLMKEVPFLSAIMNDGRRLCSVLTLTMVVMKWTNLDFGTVRKPLMPLTEAEKTKLLNERSIQAMHALLKELASN